MDSCLTCKHDGKCGITASPKNCPWYERQAPALEYETGDIVGECWRGDFDDEVKMIDCEHCGKRHPPSGSLSFCKD